MPLRLDIKRKLVQRSDRVKCVNALWPSCVPFFALISTLLPPGSLIPQSSNFFSASHSVTPPSLSSFDWIPAGALSCTRLSRGFSPTYTLATSTYGITRRTLWSSPSRRASAFIRIINMIIFIIILRKLHTYSYLPSTPHLRPSPTCYLRLANTMHIPSSSGHRAASPHGQVRRAQAVDSVRQR